MPHPFAQGRRKGGRGEAQTSLRARSRAAFRFPPRHLHCAPFEPPPHQLGRASNAVGTGQSQQLVGRHQAAVSVPSFQPECLRQSIWYQKRNSLAVSRWWMSFLRQLHLELQILTPNQNPRPWVLLPDRVGNAAVFRVFYIQSCTGLSRRPNVMWMRPETRIEMYAARCR